MHSSNRFRLEYCICSGQYFHTQVILKHLTPFNLSKGIILSKRDYTILMETYSKHLTGNMHFTGLCKSRIVTHQPCVCHDRVLSSSMKCTLMVQLLRMVVSSQGTRSSMLTQRTSGRSHTRRHSVYCDRLPPRLVTISSTVLQLLKSTVLIDTYTMGVDLCSFLTNPRLFSMSMGSTLNFQRL